jgi:protein-disulfide isomerase
MTGSLRTAAALVATGFLAACASSAPPPSVALRPRPAPLALPEEAVPGVDLSALSPAQRAQVGEWAQNAFTYCGAPRTVSASLRDGSPCVHASRMARVAAWYAASGLQGDKLARAVTAYYAAFDARKRAALELGAFGPPLGSPDAPVAIVEFSDFTCPFCQRIRPELEKFVEARAGRVRLYFKPFAIESHANSQEAAQAAEWAREKGAFWKYHDTLFDNPFAADPDSLVDFARQLGLDGADLAAALQSHRYEPKVRGSMAEAREAGIAGTPTLFFNGRMFRLPEFTEEALEFTLRDEEEWTRSGGWLRD